MRKIILNIAISLDGYIAGPNGEYDWLYTDQDYGMAEFFDQIDTSLMGRKTFDTIRKMGANPNKHLHNYVFSKTLKLFPTDGFEFIDSDVKGFVELLKKQPGKDIWLMGGGELIKYFLVHNLIDEIMLAVHPIILGNGIPLFKKLTKRVDYDFVRSESYSSGLIQLFYRKKNAPK